MIRPLVLFFLLLSGVFALTHYFAVLGSLYWYYWWFDILMHFWGGCLIAFGFHAFSTFKGIYYKPKLKGVLVLLFVFTLGWEIFEVYVGLYDLETPILEALKDMLVGFSGGLLMHQALAKYTIKP